MKKIIFVLSFSLIAFTSCKESKKTTETKKEIEKEMPEVAMEVKTISMALEPKSDSNVTGEVVFSQKDGEVFMTATMSGLTPGEHAIHLHETADCSAADGSSAGGHWNPTFKPHGKWGAEAGYHSGDIGNFMADENGNATVEFNTDQWCIDCEDETKNIIGKGVIVHQGLDDFTSQPSGNAGARVSCAGVIE
ncbi:superoxide dismutase family protein [Cellulophaga tyrosinoxydans]|uniref:Superoxide dismutase [Cu-Zn] n=1 Tax=Cellulophaga tyrosinoxydans TaxID=504486 RepID=A0A1W2CQC5_9FLAO|nr:superoxide dismutase family protein [Cellulophaga tyrosinoxydans]SMC87176.1 superoxide dismutase, Cu-Zn family [Cellulophaga tyrosinoxydans]